MWPAKRQRGNHAVAGLASHLKVQKAPAGACGVKQRAEVGCTIATLLQHAAAPLLDLLPKASKKALRASCGQACHSVGNSVSRITAYSWPAAFEEHDSLFVSEETAEVSEDGSVSEFPPKLVAARHGSTRGEDGALGCTSCSPVPSILAHVPRHHRHLFLKFPAVHTLDICCTVQQLDMHEALQHNPDFFSRLQSFSLAGCILEAEATLPTWALLCSRCSQLSSLSLGSDIDSELSFDAFKTLTRMRSLDITSIRIGDKHLSAIAGLNAVTRLCLASCHRVTDSGVAFLSNVVSLRELSLEHSYFSGVGFASLTSLTALYRLGLPRSHRLSLEGVKAISQILSVCELCFDHSPLSSTVFQALHGSMHIRKLSVNACFAKPAIDEPLWDEDDALSVDTTIALDTGDLVESYNESKYYPPISLATLGLIVSLPALTHLSIEETFFAVPRAVEAFTGLHSLECLKVHHSSQHHHVQKGFITSGSSVKLLLQCLPRLNSMTFFGSSFAVSEVLADPNSSKLTELGLECLGMVKFCGESVWPEPNHLRTLKLVVDSTFVDPGFSRALSNLVCHLESLTSLCLSAKGQAVGLLGDADISVLSNLTQLEELQLSDTHSITPHGIVALVKQLPELRRLHVRDCFDQEGREELLQLVEVFCSNCSVTLG